MKNIQVKIKKEITPEQVSNLLASCFEGGSNYWIGKVSVIDDDYCGAEFASDVPAAGGALKILDDDDDQEYLLDWNTCAEGLQKMADDDEFDRLNQICDEEDDAVTADVFLQYALFGKIVYG